MGTFSSTGTQLLWITGIVLCFKSVCKKLLKAFDLFQCFSHEADLVHQTPPAWCCKEMKTNTTNYITV